MDNTLQEIDNKIKEFCDKSLVINEFVFNEFTGEFESQNHNYPLLWATPEKMSIAKGQVSFFISVSVMDTQYEKSDLVKTLSDLAIVLTELLTYVDDDSENFMFYDVIAGDFLPFSQSIDNVCGWQGSIEFRLKFMASMSEIRFK